VRQKVHGIFGTVVTICVMNLSRFKLTDLHIIFMNSGDFFEICLRGEIGNHYNKKVVKALDNSVYIIYTIVMMHMKFKNRTKTSYTFLRVILKISEIDKQTRYYGTDHPLYNAEIHMIKCIKENEGIHVMGLADMLGVTKGAVSHIIMKLEHKGMVVKDTDPRNLSRLMLRLTAKGEMAYLQHEKLHRKYDALFNAALKNATDENKAFLKSFLNSLEEQIDILAKEEHTEF
jgi:DNA-binding MarR family transcriptional regulator